MGKKIGLNPFHMKKELIQKGSEVVLGKAAEALKEIPQKVPKKKEKGLQPDIQVMMIGARRVGKTSILASMVNSFNDVTRDTNLVLTKVNEGKSIDEGLNTMKRYFHGNPKKYCLVENMDTNATMGFNYFDLKLTVSGRRESIPRRIRFKDCAGEWISNYSNEDEIAEEVERSDVIIIAIDSVLLMEECDNPDKIGKYNHQNAVENVTNFIKDKMQPEDNLNNHKMVLFVPLKCEKYYWGNKEKDSVYYGRGMKELNEAVKRAYKDLFDFFDKPNNKPYFAVAILPILTLGGIQFYEFTAEKNADKVQSEEMKFEYCIPEGADMPKFQPKNCEQPLIYALLFESHKIQTEYTSKTYRADNKKKVAATIKEWIQDKKNLTKDTDYIKEIEKLKAKRKISEDGIDCIQGII